MLARLRAAFLVIAALTCVPSAIAETIRLKDGDEFSAQVLRKEADSVTVALPRQDVAAIDGQPLPLPVGKGAPAPAFSVPDLAGVMQTVPDPNAVILLQFWATWCPHCRSDVAMLSALHQRYQGKGLRVVSVSVDQDMKALREFAQKRPVPYPVIAAYDTAQPAAATLPERYESEGIPSYYIIDHRGAIVERLSGSITETRKDLEPMLKRLLEAGD